MSTFEQKLFSAVRGKRSPVRKRRKGQRRGPWRSESRLAFVRQMDCVNCRKRGPSEAAHLKTNGTSSKCSDEFTFPLCHECHDQYDGRSPVPIGRARGHKAFERHYGLDMREIACECHREWVLSQVPEERDEECTCAFAGDTADARGCAAHGRVA